VGTANVGSRAPVCPSFIVVLHERGFTAIHGRRLQSGRGLTSFLIWRSGDHFPNTVTLGLNYKPSYNARVAPPTLFVYLLSSCFPCSLSPMVAPFFRAN
jgi:hypothetical protein